MRKILAFLILLATLCSGQIIICSLSPIDETRDNGLIAFWKMDETSGNRTDAIASMVLVDNNTVLYGTGKYTNAADFEYSTTEYLNVADNATISFGPTETFTVAFWYKPESTAGLQLLTKATDVNAVEWGIYCSSEDYTYRFFTGSNTFSQSAAISDSAIGIGRWQFVCCWYNAGTDSLYIRVNNGGIDRGKATYGPTDGAAAFSVGRWPGYTNYADGLVDCLGVWTRCPDVSNNYAFSDSLYNSGNGWEPE